MTAPIKTTRHCVTGKRGLIFQFRLTEPERLKLNQLSLEQQRSCADVVRMLIAKA